ncbi:barwin-like endoglucanase [Cubamyces sp. BRFM 1775]|nr:barwin-like endoglucanase [Cubamyces sp. BRFM 1775]
MHFLSLAYLALAASGAAAIAIPRHHVRDTCPPKPATYAEGYLEDYCVYHKRYMAIDCESQHDTPFFDACCHPMLATETLAKDRAPQCDPANRVSSTLLSATQTATATSATPTASQVLSTSGDGDDDDDCDDEDDEPTATASSATPTATADDDDEDCDDDDDETSSSVVHTTSAASHTSVAAQTTKPASSTPAPESTHVSSTHVSSSTSHSATPSKTSSSQPQSTSGSSSSSSGNGPFDGNATFYYQKGNAGACGDKHPDSAFIAAMQTKRYGDLSEKSPLCGQQVKITNKNNGKTVTVTIADACPSCLTENDIDLSEGAFTQIATIPEGEVPISWEFL